MNNSFPREASEELIRKLTTLEKVEARLVSDGWTITGEGGTIGKGGTNGDGSPQLRAAMVVRSCGLCVIVASSCSCG